MIKKLAKTWGAITNMMQTFEEICQELHKLIPINYWREYYDRKFYIRPINPPIFHGADRAKLFYELVDKYKLRPIESSPSGALGYTLLRHEHPEIYD